MPSNFNCYYQEHILRESESDFVSWTLKAKSMFTRGMVLDFGIADAFMSPPPELTIALQKVDFINIQDHGYCYSNERFEAACLEFLVCPKLKVEHPRERDFSVISTAGAKGALNLIAQAYIDPGDIVVTTTPGYPIFKIQAERLGATVYEIPLTPKNNYLPDLSILPSEILSKIKILLVNYPNNPTGRVLTQKETDQLLSFCVTHNILLINDAAYSSVIFDNNNVGSFLANPAAAQHCIEIYSLSKMMQIPGWRLGFLVCGHSKARPLRKISLMQFTGQPKFLQDAVITCLPHVEFINSTNILVQKRLIRLVSILRSHGFDAAPPRSTFFIYVCAPTGVVNGPVFFSALECAAYFASELGIITVPWEINGNYFLRFSVAFTFDDEDKYFSLLDERLRLKKFIFRFEPGEKK